MSLLRQSFRQLFRHPRTTLAAALTLALGIGLTTFIFSFVSSLLFKPLPFEDSRRLFVLEMRNPKTRQIDALRAVELPDWEKAAQSFEAFGGFTYINTSGSHTPDMEGSAHITFGSQVTANFLELLRVEPVMGRGFRPGEDQPGSPLLALLSHRVWQRDFAGDSQILGRTIRLDGQAATVIGVMPEGFRFPFMTDVWTNLRWEDAAGPMVTAFVRLKPGVTFASAQAELRVLGPRLAETRSIPLPAPASKAFQDFYRQYTQVELRPFLDFFNSMGTDNVAWAMFAMGLFVLLIACGNVATLLSGRAVGRAQELAVRAALGASRRRLIAQMLLESTLIAMGGAALGFALSVWASRAFYLYLDQIERFEIPFWFRMNLDWRVFSFVALTVILAGLLSGLAPALRSTRLDVHAVLKDGLGASAGLRPSRLGRRLVIVQIALAMPLLVLAGVVVKTVATARHAFPARDPEHLLTARVEPAPRGIRPESRPDFEELIRQIAGLPGVESAALSERAPAPMFGTMETIEVERQPADRASGPVRAFREIVSPGYFGVLGVKLISGRDFSAADREQGLPVAIVNQSFALKHWEANSALGRKFRRPNPSDEWLTVIGIVPDLQMQGMYTRLHGGSGFYLPQSQHPFQQEFTLFLRLKSTTSDLSRPLQNAVRLIAPNYRLRSLAMLPEAMNRSARGYTLISALFVGFGLAAMVLAGVGVAGILSFTITQRTREFGIRIALGATRPIVLKLVLRQTGRQVALGLALGLGLSLTATRVAQSLFVSVAPHDPGIYGLIIGSVAVAALLSAWLPARRATRLNPAIALRHE